MDNEYSKELMHFSLGEIFSNHKYIRREENTDGQKSKFRYFYDSVKSTVSNAITSFTDSWKAGKLESRNLLKNRSAALQTTSTTR